MTLLDQFKQFINNELTNELIEEPAVPAEPEKVYEDGIDLVAVVNGVEYRFDYNCYADYGTSQLYDFTLYEIV